MIVSGKMVEIKPPDPMRNSTKSLILAGLVFPATVLLLGFGILLYGLS
jgi:hypothetical protein